jgi:hypothetical protein
MTKSQKNPKSQKSKSQKSKFQKSKGRSVPAGIFGIWDFGIWDFFGIWPLGFGISFTLVVAARPRFLSVRSFAG